MGKKNVLNVDLDIVKDEATRVDNAATYLVAETLTETAPNTTLTAVKTANLAFAGSQNSIVAIGQSADTEATNIRNLGYEFAQYDDMLAAYEKADQTNLNILFNLPILNY